MRRGAVPVLCLVQLVDVLGVTSAITAIPLIVRGVGATGAAAGPIATTYAVFFGGLLVLGARLGDRYGHRRVLVAGVAAFALVAVLGGTAAALPQVLAARALQGAAAAVSSPSALRLLLHATEAGRDRNRALAAWSAVGAAAGTTGFLVGGFLAQGLGWQWVFWVNAPTGLLLLVAIVLRVPAGPAPDPRAALDVPGALLLLAAVTPVIAGAALAEGGSGRPLGAALVGVGLLIGIAFVQRMRTAAAPLLPIDAVRSRDLRRGTVESFVNTATTSSSAVLATVFLQGTLHQSAFEAGLTLMTLSIGVIVGAPVASRLSRRLRLDAVTGAGLAAIGVGNAVLALLGVAWWGVVVGVALSGIGLGLASVGATATGTTVPPGLAGIATGVLNTGAQLGTALGTAAVVLVASVTSVRVGWGLAAALALATAAWCLLRSSDERPARSRGRHAARDEPTRA